MIWALVAMATLLAAYLTSMLWHQDGDDDVDGIIQRNHDIVSFRHFGELRRDDRLRLRAIPNQRLVVAFGLENSFTTSDSETHQRFLNAASRVITDTNTENARWVKLFGFASSTLQKVAATMLSLGQQDGTQRQATVQTLPIASAVSVLCLATVLDFLYSVAEVDEYVFDIEQACIATKAIDKLWVQSKDPSRPVSSEDQADLDQAIEMLVPPYVQTPHSPGGTPAGSNPLNMIIPAYETLWRVVLPTYVHIGFRDHGSRCSQLLGPVPGCLGTRSKAEDLALGVSKEALRLFGQPKRIYRAPIGHVAGDGSTAKSAFPSADVECLHRDERIWGPDAAYFRPERFHQGLSPQQTRAYMPFGAKPHLCPAAKGFGERMLALLLTVLVRDLGTKGCRGARIVFADKKLDGEGNENQQKAVVLPSGRGEMDGWLLIKRSETE